ncbi:MAG: MraY family glycosyltransferase [Candidatus Berkelbacteria bacterium]|nr:MraY family glycosyltransferase [Candidatus Berkelbacteria bacterium]
MSIFGSYNALQIAIFSLAFLLIVFLINFLAIYVARKIGVVDNPNGDKLKIHKKITPLSGGIALFPIMIFVLWTGSQYLTIQVFAIIFCSMVMVFILGLIDDKYQLKPSVRLLIHALLVALIYFSLFSATKIAYLAFLPILVIYVGTIVSVNLIDGMDGICTSLAVVSAIGFFLIANLDNLQFVGLISFAIAAAAIIFLIFNFNPAKAFLGSSGSELLGFVFGLIALIISGGNLLKFILLITIVGIPIFDMIRVMVVRFINKKPIMAGDRNHIFDWMKSRGLSQKQIWSILFLAQIILVGVITLFYIKIY